MIGLNAALVLVLILSHTSLTMFQLRHIGLTAHTRGWALIQGRNLRPVLKAR